MLSTYHDQSQGQQRGSNTVFSILADDIKIVHFGDLGHILTSDQAAEIGTADIALVPVGGYFTIDAQQAHKVVEQVDAKIVIPMHYKTPKCEFPIAGVEDFLRAKPT